MHDVSSIITVSAGGSSPSVFTNTPTAGTGVWATVEAFDDLTDQLDAANVQILAAGTYMNLQFIAARTPDYVDGGDYTALTAEMTFGNEMIWLGQHDFFAAMRAHSTFTFVGGSALHFDIGSSVTSAVPGGPTVGLTGPAGSGTVALDCSASNTFWMNTAFANTGVTITFAPSNAKDGTTYRVYFVVLNTGTAVTIAWSYPGGTIIGNANAINPLPDGKTYWIDFEFLTLSGPVLVLALVGYGKST